jgi:hypothetical protein
MPVKGLAGISTRLMIDAVYKITVLFHFLVPAVELRRRDLAVFLFLSPEIQMLRISDSGCRS